MRYLITGTAGFIGFHVAKQALALGHKVCGYDNVNDYYDPSLKRARLKVLHDDKNFKFVEKDICDAQALDTAWRQFDPTHVIHLAAQVGVRYSSENPMAYVQSNMVGFQHVIEQVRKTKPVSFVYASSSSVYGDSKQLPFSEKNPLGEPISFYAATKVANEVVAKSYQRLHGVNSIGLRFFTVYGPYGRPDMAVYKFAKLMRAGKPIPLFNGGNMVRDFTFVDDIVQGVLGATTLVGKTDVFNLGYGQLVTVERLINLLEANLGVKAVRELLPHQGGDMEQTLSDVSKAKKALGYDPKTSIDDGIKKFADWFLSYE